MTISFWYFCAGLGVAYFLGIWIGWVARGYRHDRFVDKVRRAVEWNS